MIMFKMLRRRQTIVTIFSSVRIKTFLFQINELYEEVLHEILHCVGAEKTCMNQKNMIAFAREVFKIEDDVHESVYRAVMEKEVSAARCVLPHVLELFGHKPLCY